MRARLERQTAGESFRFICDFKMAEKMGPVITGAGGEIVGKDIRSYGVVILVRKKTMIHKG